MKTKVLVVDDSAYTRQLIRKIVEQEPALEVVGIASDGIDAMGKTLRYEPDLITLDFEMPEMDGFSFLRWLMRERPTPVIMLSSHADSKTVFKALELGAVDFIAKPTKRASVELQVIEKDLIRKIKGIKDIRLDILSKNLELLEGDETAEAAEEVKEGNIQLVAIGSSTGGPAALQIVLSRLPADFQPAIVVSQHMPRGFTGPLSERLNKLSKLKIKEAEEGDHIEPKTVFICPGGAHLSLQKKRHKNVITLKESDITDKYIPSVDYMMVSVARHFGARAMGVLLTGMGNDGKKGMLEIKGKGGYTIAESEESAVVFGMPAEAIKSGSVESVLSVSEIPSEMTRVAKLSKKREQ